MNNEGNPHWQTFAPAQNDPLFNNYKPVFIMRWLVNINMTPYINQKAVLYYVTKYCIKTEMKTMKLDKLIKDLLLYIFSKNSISLLMIKFTNKLIRKRNISVQEVYYLFLQLDLTNLFFLVSNMNI